MLNETNEIVDRQAQIEWLHARYIARGQGKESPPETGSAPPNMEEVELALGYIPPDEYETWIRVGMALKAGGCECSMWDNWSSTSEKYDASEIESKWNSFRNKGITLGSLFYLAGEHGYRSQPQDTEADEQGRPAGRESQASKLLALVEGDPSIKVFRIPAGESFVVFPRATSIRELIAETVPLNSEPFATFLRRRYRAAHRSLCGSESISTVTSYLAGDAVTEPAVFVRVAHHGGNIYVDLADEQRQVVEISAHGWHIISSDSCPVHFWHPAGMLALPMPERGGSLNCLDNYMNLSVNGQSDSSLLERVILYLLSTFVDGPLIVLEIVGEKGSAKTTQAKIIRKLLDPNEADVMSPPTEDRDLGLACRNQWIVAIDNASKLSAARSDMHCRISTGAAWRERQLNTNGGEFMYKFRRPQIITSIRDVITKPDLTDRKLKLKLSQIPKERRRTERAILFALDIELPRIIGALFDLLSGTLHELPNVNAKELPRMADAAEFLLAAEKHLRWDEGKVAAMFAEEALADAADMLDGDPFAAALVGLVESKGGHWTATATEVLNALAGPSGHLPVYWPQTGRSLRDRLKELAPGLRQFGFCYSQEPNGNRRYLFEYTSNRSASSAGSAKPWPAAS